MKNKKILMIVIIIIAVLVIAGTVLGYLFIATDTFKSDKELFSKYMSQNISDLKEISNLEIVKEINNLKNQSKYDLNTKINMIYSEGGEISNPINDLSATLNIQKDNDSEYFYADSKIMHSDEKYLDLKLIKQEGFYGLGFPDVVKQIISIKDDENVEDVAKDIGIDNDLLNSIKNVIDGTTTISEEILSQEEKEELKQKYLQLVVDGISDGTFTSLKKAMITYNNETIKTNAYTVSLNSEQVENVIVQILNKLKEESVIIDMDYQEQINGCLKTITEEKEIPAMKITVYEQKEQTIRTILEIDTYKITLENKKDNGEHKSIIQISNLDSETISENTIEISKRNTENQEIFEIKLEIFNGEDNYTINFLNKLEKDGEITTLDSSTKYKKDILEIGLNLESKLKLNSNFENKLTLEQNNNVVLNNLNQEGRKYIINLLKEKVSEKIAGKLGNLIEVLGISGEEETTENVNQEMPQAEINKFNAKFEFYTGESVSVENVKALLDIVKNNLSGYAIVTGDEADETTSEEANSVIQLIIEKDTINEEAIGKVLEKIDSQKKYKVKITYKSDNGLIEYITIEEAKG